MSFDWVENFDSKRLDKAKWIIKEFSFFWDKYEIEWENINCRWFSDNTIFLETKSWLEFFKIKDENWNKYLENITNIADIKKDFRFKIKVEDWEKKIIYNWEWVESVGEEENVKNKRENDEAKVVANEDSIDFEDDKNEEFEISNIDILFLKDLDVFLKNPEIFNIFKEAKKGNKDLIFYILSSPNYKEIINNFNNILLKYTWNDFDLDVFENYKIMIEKSKQVIDEDINLTINDYTLKEFAEKWLLTENNINTLFDNLEEVKTEEGLKRYDILFSKINKKLIKKYIDKMKDFVRNVDFYDNDRKNDIIEYLDEWIERPFTFGNEF